MSNSPAPLQPYLTALIVVGSRRKRSQRAIDALSVQTYGTRMEIIVVDISPESTPALGPTCHTEIPYRYLRMPDTLEWGLAKAEGFRQARGEAVAIIEDHCFPEPEWAEAVARAFQSGPWSAVGYAFVNANPRTYLSRAGLFCDYHPWTKPIPGGPRRLLPGNNVAYRRQPALACGENLAALISPDFVFLEQLHHAGHAMFMANDAIAAHQNFIYLRPYLTANLLYCRVLAANRAKFGDWGRSRRIFYSLAVLPGAPAIKLLRMIRGLPGRGQWALFFQSLPLIGVTFALSAIGESIGYLFGEGNAGKAFQWYELDAVREPE